MILSDMLELASRNLRNSRLRNGLTAAGLLFIVASGFSFIFGLMRVVNMAHGSFYMLGLYLAYSLATAIGGALGYWGGILAAAAIVAMLGSSSPHIVGGRVAVIERPSK